MVNTHVDDLENAFEEPIEGVFVNAKLAMRGHERMMELSVTLGPGKMQVVGVLVAPDDRCHHAAADKERLGTGGV